MAVALTTLKKLCELLGAVQDAGPNSKESNTPGFTGAKEGYAGYAQTLGCLFLGK